MAGQQFQYDDSGNTFFYFLTSFVGLIVIPATYYLWPRDQNAEQLRLKSLRRVHGRCLWYRLRHMKSQQSIVPTLKKAALLFGWAIFLFLAYKVSKLDREYQEYNPYEVLHLEAGVSIAEIKKQYRVLSLKHHPDKGGDEAMFMKLAKAYSALTNEEARDNWEKYGNPDGPRVTSFGIALPAWIVDQKNSMLVLLVYGLAFMVILPKPFPFINILINPIITSLFILINTTQLFMHFMYKTPTMNMKRLVMVLTAAFEFDPRSNKEAIIRPTDNIEVPQLIRELGNINVKKKEPPFCYPYSLKARVLLLTHLARMDVSENIEEDQRFVMKKCPALLQEMINVGCQLTMMATSRGGLRAPRLTSIENCMKLSQMVVQGLQEAKSPLLQLPHFEEEHLRYCISKKYKVRTLQDLVSLKDSDRRNMLRFLGEEKYDEVMAVLGSIPYINMETKLQGEIVQQRLNTHTFNKNHYQGDAKNKKVWQNKNKGAKKAAKSKKKKLTKKKPVTQQQAKGDKAKHPNGNDVASASKMEEDDLSDKGSESDEAEGNKDSPSERDEESDKQSDTEVDEIAGDDEEEWEALQQSIQRRERALLETKSKVTHPVYSLYFPEEKQEWWWLYIADRKEQTLVSMPNHVCTLKDTEELEVHEAKAMMDNHPQWDIPETEEEEDDQEDSDGIEESEEDEEDND
uniref:Translocation protein SEC63 homolog n=1 Tax=Sinocyclocheilus anshuiensis TaxID=1608454 RepID=A0A671NKS2_9TELE